MLRPAGALVIGRTVAPEDGVDARMKRQLDVILGAMGVEPRGANARDDVEHLLGASAPTRERRDRRARGPRERTPRQFIERHRGGARFSALPERVKDDAMARLAAWAAAGLRLARCGVVRAACIRAADLQVRRSGGADMPNMTGNEMLTELGKRLVSGSLSDAALQRATDATPNVAILPWVNVVKIGGQSIMDRGRSAVGPVVDEIVANLPRHKMILGTGAGTRARHVYSLAIDLGLPVGVLTVLGTAVAWQNAQMLQYLLAQARHRVPRAGRLRVAAALPDGARRGDLPGHAALQAVGGESRSSGASRRSAPTPAAS